MPPLERSSSDSEYKFNPPDPDPSSPDDGGGSSGPHPPFKRKKPKFIRKKPPKKEESKVQVKVKGGDSRGEGGAGGSGTSGPVTVGGTNINIRGGGFGGGGGGGAVAAASSSGAGTSGGGAQQAAGALLAAIQKPKKKKKQSGITAAKKRYTDKRKVKLGELRALKSKRLREHSTRTKKLPKGERAKQRKAFKDKVNTQYREVTKRFPTARGLKDLQTVRGLIDKIERVRLPS